MQDDGGCEGNEHIVALVHAAPQLRALKLFNYGNSRRMYASDRATDAGLQGPVMIAAHSTGWVATCGTW